MTKVLKGKKDFIYFVIGLSIIIIFPVMLISIVGIHRNSRQMQERNLEYWRVIVQDIIYDMDKAIKEYDNLSMTALLQEELLSILYRQDFDQVEYTEAVSWLEQQLTVELFLNHSLVSSFRVLGNNGFYYTSDRSIQRDETIVLTKSVEKSGKISVFMPSADQNGAEGSFVTIGRYIYSYKDLSPLGYFLMSIKPTELDRIWANKDLDSIRVLVLDENGDVVYGSREEGWEKEKLYGFMTQEADSFLGPREAGEWMYVYEKSDYTGWTAVVAVPREVYHTSVWSLNRTFLVAGTIAVLLASALAYFLIRSVYVTQLENQKNETQRSRAEMKALQTQINPHFLYNTLGAVNMYSVMEDTEAVQEITDALSKMFRYAVQNPMVPVGIGEEVGHVVNYLKIQKYRQGELPKLEIFTEEAENASVLRLCLQPIVENIFKHAFAEGIRPEHYIRIRAFREGERLLVDVTDNGRGPSMDVDDMEYVTDGEQNGRGIGLSNVHRRLKLAFGEAYGLRISGRVGKGMTIRICQPWQVIEKNETGGIPKWKN